MDSDNIAAQADFARSIFEQEYDDLRNARAQELPPAYKLPSELLRSIHDNLIEREKTGPPRYRKVIIAGGSKHFSNRSLSDLSPVSLEHLKIGCAARGQAVLLRICSRGCSTSALQVLAEDENGWAVPLSIYHASPDLAQLCVHGTLIAVKEPWLKESKDGYFIRVDSPSDVILWPDIAWHKSTSLTSRYHIQQARARGGSLFVKGDMKAAITTYEEGLYTPSETHSKTGKADTDIVKLNAALAYLKIGMPGTAFGHLEEIDTNLLDEKQLLKHAYRKGLALYALGQYEACLRHLKGSKGGSPSQEVSDLLAKASQRHQEANTGNYDWADIFEKLRQGQPANVADYVGPIKVADKRPKGAGVITARKVEAGELLVVANPIAMAGSDGKLDTHTLGLNLASKSLDPPSVMQVISKVYNTVRDQPAMCAQLDSMFAGHSFKRRPYEHEHVRLGDTTSLDAGRIEGIVTYNSFKPQCISTPLSEDQSSSHEEAHLTSPSALYFLPSFVNHSCLGNASFVFFGSVLVVRATQKISEGEEVLFSYCDPAANFEERKEHLARYGFACECDLCKRDKRLNALEEKRIQGKVDAILSGDPNLAALLDQVLQLELIHGPEQNQPVYSLYRCRRALSEHYSRSGADKSIVITTEMSALVALGVQFATEDGPSRQRTDAKSNFKQDPLIAMQDAIISCLKVSHEHLLLEEEDLAKQWAHDAVRLHDIEFGPGMLLYRMGSFMEDQGWKQVKQLVAAYRKF